MALTIPFSLLFASICLDLRHIPANLLSLGALDFGMVVDGAVVMVENIVRHLGRQRERQQDTPMERIRAAAHEVQRPVFYAIAIIITAYMPIFTLQRVEGRLFKPMAWTVAFALLGALIFSMLIAPVLASLLFRKGRKRVAQPGDGISDRSLPHCGTLGHSVPLDHRGVAAARASPWRFIWCSAASSVRNFCRIWTKARFGCAARWRPAPA